MNGGVLTPDHDNDSPASLLVLILLGDRRDNRNQAAGTDSQSDADKLATLGNDAMSTDGNGLDLLSDTEKLVTLNAAADTATLKSIKLLNASNLPPI